LNDASYRGLNETEELNDERLALYAVAYAARSIDFPKKGRLTEGRQKSVRIRGFDVAKKVQHKKLTNRDENRHLDVKKEINYKVSDLIDRYWTHCGSKKNSADREKSIVEGIRSELGRKFVREVDGVAVQH
jgi:hypothetical protein